MGRVTTLLIVFFLTRSILFSPVSVRADQVADTPSPAARGLAHYIMGVNYDLLGKTAAALHEYQESARTDKISFAPHLRLGVALAHEGNYPAAVRELSSAVSIDPTDLQAHYYLALVYSSIHEFVKAAEQYEIILKKLSLVEPKNAELFAYLGQLYFSQGREDKAIEQFEKVLKIDPKNTSAMLTVAL